MKINSFWEKEHFLNITLSYYEATENCPEGLYLTASVDKVEVDCESCKFWDDEYVYCKKKNKFPNQICFDLTYKGRKIITGQARRIVIQHLKDLVKKPETQTAIILDLKGGNEKRKI